ncbi:MAG TPA: HdeA/HdeB family chaperone [Candidatus Angelobacter sp.]|nr:HdeA/HdeB family chaperone [Candidatus Angelobacter sp.]
MKRFHFAACLSLCALAALLAPTVQAQSVAAANCETYKNAAKNPSQNDLFAAYLQGYANATSPDPRFTQSDAALAEDTRKVLEYCKQNGKSTFNEAVAAVLGSASSGGSGGAAAAASQEPTSCKAGPTQHCGGCSITCNGGKQATCQQGTDNAFGEASCTFQSRCTCKKT